MAPAHIKLRCQKVAPEPQTSPPPPHPLHPNLPVTLLWIGHPQRVRPGRLRSDERTTRPKIQRPDQRGGERGETNGSDGEEEETEGEEREFKNNKNNSKKTNNREKEREERERSRRSSEAPKVLQLIKMICIYL